MGVVCAQVYGIDATKYSRKVMLVPDLSTFSVSGIAQIGAGVDSLTTAFIRVRISV